MKSTLKTAARRYLGGRYAPTAAAWRRVRRHLPWNAYQAARVERATRAYADACGLQVRRGPFVDMVYIEDVLDESRTLLPKLLGSYERELHPWIYHLLAGSYDTWIDVGCAEGYYAVGLARAARDSQVYGFDIDPRNRELCRALAEKNGVSEQLTVDSYCDLSFLNTHLGPTTLLFLDCEG